MKTVLLPYDKGKLKAGIAQERKITVLRGSLEEYQPQDTQENLVEQALANPIGSKPLWELARGKKRVTVIISDHTRPVPSKILLPPMLREIRRGNPDAEITLLVATGCHRETTREELIAKCGAELVEREKIVIHDCDDAENLVELEHLPSGGRLLVNRLAVEADLLVAEGFIEPHFFAGYSGGRKSVLPGIASRKTVLANHCAKFIASPNACAGSLDENPIHKDMLFAARQAGLAFVANVVINAKKEVVAAFAGDVNEAHRAGVRFLENLCAVKAPLAPIVVTTNNGYPLDQNLYQAVKGMSTAEALVKQGGVIIMAAGCADGIGGEGFAKFFRETPDAQELLKRLETVDAEDTTPDQWQAQICARVLCRARVILISLLPEETVRSFGMLPAKDFAEALRLADTLVGEENTPITFVPEGISVVAKGI